MKKNLTLSLLVAAAIFLAPLNLFFKWHETEAYVGGIFTDYLVQKLWLGEIPVLLTIIIWLVGKIRGEQKKIQPFLKKNAAWLILLLFLGARQFFSTAPIVSLWFFTKLLEWLLFGWCLIDVWPNLRHRLIQTALLLTIVFQGFITTAQFIHQQPLFDYQVLGETRFAGAINVARAEFKTGEKILPYGTTAHPNILAGVMVLAGAWWLTQRAISQKKLGWLELGIVALVSWSIFLTQSTSALISWTLFLLWQEWSWLQARGTNIALGLLILTPAVLLFAPTTWQTESFFRRNLLNAHAVTEFFKQPLIGVGLNQFTGTMANLTGQASDQFIRFIQPAHHVPLLWLAETGLLGLVLIWSLFKKINWTKPTPWLLTLTPLLSLDHYLLTQWVGGLLLTIIIVYQHQSDKNKN